MSFNENQYQRPFLYPSTEVNAKSLKEGFENNKRTKQKLVNNSQQNSVSLSKTGIMKRQLRKAQDGAEQGGAGVEEIQQLVFQFAELNQQDPKAIMEELQGMEQEQQQQALQQMQQAVMQASSQEGQPQGQPVPQEQGAPQPEMKWGGTADFDAIRKNLIKMYKSGGTVDESTLDTSTTEAYVGGLKEVFKKKMFLGHAMGAMKNRGVEAPQFAPMQEQMPTAENGIEITEDGTPMWDGKDLPQFIKDKYGVETVEELQNITNYNSIADPSVENNPDWIGIISELNKGIWENSDYGKTAMEKGYTYEQTQATNTDNQNMLGEAELAQFKTDMATAQAEKEKLALDAKTNTADAETNTAGYTGFDESPVVLTPDQEAKAEEERRAALTQAERDAEDKKNTETKYEEGVTYKYVDGKMVAVKDGTGTGDATKGQAKQNRVYPGHNAEGNYGMTGRRNLNSGFLNDMMNIVNRRQVGVQGNMKPEDFQNRLNQSGIADVKYKNNIFGEKLKIRFNPTTGQQETVNQNGEVVNQTDSEYNISEGQWADLNPGVPYPGAGNTGTGNTGTSNAGTGVGPTGNNRRLGRRDDISYNKYYETATDENWNPLSNDSQGSVPAQNNNRDGISFNKQYETATDENWNPISNPQGSAASQNDYGNEIDAVYNTAEANLRAQGIVNPTQEQLNKAIDNVETVRGMSKVPAGEMAPNFKYGGQAGGLYLPKAKWGMNSEYSDVAKFKPIYETTIDYGAGADVLFEAGARFNEFLEGMNRVMTPEEERSQQSTDRKFNTVGPDSALEGLYDKQTGRQLPQDLGAPTLAGTQQPMPGMGGQNFTQDPFGISSSRLPYRKDGGLVRAKAGLEVGKELTLTPAQIKMMEKLGFKIKQLY